MGKYSVSCHFNIGQPLIYIQFQGALSSAHHYIVFFSQPLFITITAEPNR